MSRITVTSASFALAALLVAAFAVLAVRGPADSRPVNELPRGVDGAELLALLQATGRQVAELKPGVRLYENTRFSLRVRQPHSGVVPVTLVARGTGVARVYPYLILSADGRPQDAIYVPSDEWGLYRMEAHLSAGDHEIELAYVNDGSHYPEARDLDIRQIEIGGDIDAASRFQRWSVPCRIAPDRLARRGYGTPDPGGYRLWPRGYVEDEIEVGIGGDYAIRIDARAENQSILELFVDSEPIASQSVIPGLSVDSTSVRLEPGRHRIGLRNSESSSGDLIVRNIVVGDPPGARAPAPLELNGRPVNLTGATIQTRSSGVAREDSWILFGNGYLQQTVGTEVDREVTLRVLSSGDLCEGIGPRLVVMRNDDQLAVLEVDRAEPSEFELSLRLEAGWHRISLVYENDRVSSDCDRNLRLHSIGFLPEPRRASS